MPVFMQLAPGHKNVNLIPITTVNILIKYFSMLAATPKNN